MLDNKDLVKNSFIAVSIIVVIFASIVLLAVFTRQSQTEKIKATIQAVLEEKENSRYKVGKRIYINSAMSDNAYVFELKDSMENTDNYAVLMRVIGLNGPVAVVFVGNETNVEYAGIAGIKNKDINPITYGITDAVENYWQENIKTLIEKRQK